LLGQYAYRLGSVPVNRGKRGKAIAKMLADVKKGEALPGQLVIYSQGTRLAPGVKRPYKVGTAVLYEQMGICHLFHRVCRKKSFWRGWSARSRRPRRRCWMRRGLCGLLSLHERVC